MRSAMETITSVAQTSNRKRDPRRGQLILDLKSFDVSLVRLGWGSVDKTLGTRLGPILDHICQSQTENWLACVLKTYPIPGRLKSVLKF